MKAASLIAATGAVAIVGLVAGTYLYTQQATQGACTGGAVAGASIGGPLALHDSGGRAVTEKDILAGASLVYFGYANCPDVCPVDNARNDEAANLLAEKGIAVTPVFISVDPTRDTPEILDGYQSAFSHLRAYSGTEEEVAAAAKAWRVYYNIDPAELAKYRADPSGFYTVDHTTMTYLTRPGGEVVAVFQRENSAQEIAEWSPCYLASS